MLAHPSRNGLLDDGSGSIVGRSAYDVARNVPLAARAVAAHDRIGGVLLTSTSPTLASTFPGGLTATVVVAGAVVLAVILGVLALLDRSTPMWALALVGLLEVGLLVVTAIGVIAWIGGDAPAEPVVFFFYLLACLAIPPLMVWWGRGEPGRWGSGVVAIACLVLAVLVLRVEQVWSGTGGGIAP